MRPLHWIVKSRSLEKTISFYSEVLGLKVLRHEEFKEGCEAACNGRWGGAWSKTIIGSESEKESFCLEIVFNWGVEDYPRGNAFRCLRVGDETGEKEKKAITWWKRENPLKTFPSHTIYDPDETLIEFDPNDNIEFVYVSLLVKDLQLSINFYEKKLLGKIQNLDTVSCLVRFGADNETAIQLVEVSKDEKIVQGDSQGRFAVETEEGEPNILANRVGKDHVIHGPLALPPHNENVVVIKDYDGNEYAFVERLGYARCMVAGERSIDWKSREEFRLSKRTKRQIEDDEKEIKNDKKETGAN